MPHKAGPAGGYCPAGVAFTINPNAKYDQPPPTCLNTAMQPWASLPPNEPQIVLTPAGIGTYTWLWTESAATECALRGKVLFAVMTLLFANVAESMIPNS